MLKRRIAKIEIVLFISDLSFLLKPLRGQYDLVAATFKVA
jgi:hypothetical protein